MIIVAGLFGWCGERVDQGGHRFMSYFCDDALINEGLTDKGGENDLRQDAATATRRAAAQVLAAAKASGSINAELVLHAVVELLQAARGRQAA